MIKNKKILEIRKKIKKKFSLGSWMQIPSSDIAEIMGQSNFDWVALDMEHGSFELNQTVEIFRALELGNTLPMVRVPTDDTALAKKVLDFGAGGIIFPNISSYEQIENNISEISFPPLGNRGIGFNRDNLFGMNFSKEKITKYKPIIFAMIENIQGVENLEEILKVKNLDGIFIGPYDLSASLNCIGNFKNKLFKQNISYILKKSRKNKFPVGIHVPSGEKKEIKKCLKMGFSFIADGTDAVFIYKNSFK